MRDTQFRKDLLYGYTLTGASYAESDDQFLLLCNLQVINRFDRSCQNPLIGWSSFIILRLFNVKSFRIFDIKETETQ